MNVVFSARVESDLQEIVDYISRDNPARALTFVDELEQTALSIGLHPFAYRARPDIAPQARSAAHGKYIVLFEVRTDVVVVKRIVHGSRDLRKTWRRN